MSEIDSPRRDSAKQRSRRIKLDYYKKLSRVEKAKWGFTILVGAVAGLYVVWTLGGWAIGSEAAARQFSPGPVAAAHGAWDGKCSACHASAVALRDDSVGFGELVGVAEKSAAACQACHAGPPHLNEADQHLESNCAACHKDHRGVDADLARVDDAACTRCHADINAVAKLRKNGKSSTLPNVTQFGEPPYHPEFRSIESDPGNIKFSHVPHMTEHRFPKGVENERHLQCADCHRLDDAQVRADGKPATSVPGGGGYMQPINYDKHCKVCHDDDLHLEGDIRGDIPHRSRPAAIRAILTELAGKKVTSLPLMPAPHPKTPPTPGKTPNSNDAQKLTESQWQKILKAEQKLQSQPPSVKDSNCAMCHEFEKAKQGSDLMPDVAPPSIPAVWLSHAKFDHAAHRGVSCLECHAGAQRGDQTGKSRLDNKTVHIPNHKKCLECHAPVTKYGGAGARFDCAECHRYHGGELYPHGKGAEVRALRDRRAATDFIDGARSKTPGK